MATDTEIVATDEIATDANGTEADETEDDDDTPEARTRKTNYHQPLPVLTMSFHKSLQVVPDMVGYLEQWAKENDLMVEFREGGRKGLSNRLFARFDTAETYAIRTAGTVSSETRSMLAAVKAKADAQGVSIEDLLRAALEKL